MTSRKETSGDHSPKDLHRQMVVQHWLKFESEFPEGSDGSEELFELLFKTHFRKCSKCNSKNVIRIKNDRHIRCVECAHKSSLTAGTFFHNVRSPKAWLGAIRLLEQGLEFSIRLFSLLAKVAYATAWEILKKIELVLSNSFDPKAIFVPSKIFEKVFLKRSRETPAREHPKTEQRVAEREQARNVPINPSNCSEREHKILAVIGAQVVDADFISEQTDLPTSVVSALLMMLELAGVIERLDGDQFKRKFLNSSLGKSESCVRTFVKKFVRHLKRCERGISRKYLHNNIARFWCLIDRDRWKEGALLRECLHSHHISNIALRLENAPLMVQLPPLAD